MKTFFSQWRVLLTLCAVGIFFAPEGRAESPDSLPKPTSYVADFAGVIDASSKESLEAYCLQVYTKAHATIEVVTVKSLDGLQIDDFTTQLQAKWRVGPKKTDRGIVMVFAIQDHKWRIEVGYGLEGLLNDAKAGDMGRDMVPQLKQGQYGQAALLGVQELGNVIATDAGVTLDAPAPVHTYHRENVRRSRGSSWPVWIFVALFVFSLLGRRRGGGGGGFPWWLFFLNGIGGGGGGRGGWDNDGGGGGSSGGSSGGSDFGGGFGGDSGGGGASGDW